MKFVLSEKQFVKLWNNSIDDKDKSNIREIALSKKSKIFADDFTILETIRHVFFYRDGKFIANLSYEDLQYWIKFQLNRINAFYSLKWGSD